MFFLNDRTPFPTKLLPGFLGLVCRANPRKPGRSFVAAFFAPFLLLGRAELYQTFATRKPFLQSFLQIFLGPLQAVGY